MKKILVTLILVLAVSIIGYTVTQHLTTIAALGDEWLVALTWLEADPLGRYDEATKKLQNIASTMETELIKAIQCKMSPEEAKFTLCAAYSFVAMQFGVDALLEISEAKKEVSEEIIKWVATKLQELSL